MMNSLWKLNHSFRKNLRHLICRSEIYRAMQHTASHKNTCPDSVPVALLKKVVLDRMHRICSAILQDGYISLNFPVRKLPWTHLHQIWHSFNGRRCDECFNDRLRGVDSVGPKFVFSLSWLTSPVAVNTSSSYVLPSSETDEKSAFTGVWYIVILHTHKGLLFGNCRYDTFGVLLNPANFLRCFLSNHSLARNFLLF